jgi:hypothetical protein
MSRVLCFQKAKKFRETAPSPAFADEDERRWLVWTICAPFSWENEVLFPIDAVPIAFVVMHECCQK